MRSMQRAVGLLLATALVVVAGCGGSGGSASGGGGGSGGTLKIGVISPFTGDLATGGEAIYQGYEMAAEEANAHGGVLGKKVQLVKGDASTPQAGITVAQRLATQDNVDAFVGGYASAVEETASKTSARYKKLYWETNALATDLTQRGLPNFLRVGPTASTFGQESATATAKGVAQKLGIPDSQLKVYIEHESSVYGTGVAAVQKQALQSAGVKVVGVGSHDAAAADLTASVQRAQKASPDVWLLTGYNPDLGLLLKTAQRQGFDPKAIMLVGQGDTADTLQALGAKTLKGVLVSAYPHTDISPSYGPGVAQWLAAYKKKYGHAPSFPQTMSAYVGMKILFDVANKAGSLDPTAIRKAAASFSKPPNSYVNGFGVKFDGSFQNTETPMTVVQWQGSKTVTVLPTQAAGSNKLQALSGQ